MIRILLITLGTFVAAKAALGLSLITIIAGPSTAVAQESAPLKVIADLMVRKGFQNATLSHLCDLFHLRHPVGGGDCKGFSMATDVDDKDNDALIADNVKIYSAGWFPSFFTYFEPGSTVARVILVAQNATSGYAFLTGTDGKLRQAALGSKVTGDWRWSPVAINNDLRGIFARESSYWSHQQKDLEALPDRKD